MDGDCVQLSVVYEYTDTPNEPFHQCYHTFVEGAEQIPD